jgi:biofilm PGA synthesis N-glycosyltransferase PgaC
MISIFLIITFIYVILIGSFIIGFDKVENFNTESSTVATKFSIVIPFRDEAPNLPDLLESLMKLDYPKHMFEVLLVDDESEDNSVEIIQNIIDSFPENNIQILKNKRQSNSPKKDAITTAIQIAQYNWIITTDADCVLSPKWLKTIDTFIQNNAPKMIIAPVTYSNQSSFLERFQLLDFLSLQSVTIAGFGIGRPFLCNGANLAYHKDLFKTLHGFDGNATIASGDDIFLMDKAIKICFEDVKYLKSTEALVTTKSQSSLNGLIQQRLRWVAKMSSYSNTFGKLVGLIVLLMNALIIIITTLVIIGVFKLKFLLVYFSLKFFLDLILIKKSARFFNQKLSLIYYALSSVVYPFFSIFITINSMFFGFKWKNRSFKK